MQGGASHLWRQWGASVTQTGGAGKRDGSGNGGRVGVAITDGAGPHRPIVPSPRLAKGGAACGDCQGAAVAPPQPGHRQRSVSVSQQ